jgi:DNA invertase Pin-like site-specific DNA recombinase
VQATLDDQCSPLWKLTAGPFGAVPFDARDIADELTAKGVVLSLGVSTHDPADPVGRLLFNVLGMVARMRTREGMAVAKAKGRLKGKQPKLSKTQRKHLLTLHDAGEHTQAELFRVSRTTVYRELQRRNL